MSGPFYTPSMPYGRGFLGLPLINYGDVVSRPYRLAFDLGSPSKIHNGTTSAAKDVHPYAWIAVSDSVGGTH